MLLGSASTFATFVALSLPAPAQVIEMVNHDGKTYACERSGLMGSGDSCGTQNFDVIVVGTILTVAPDSEGATHITLKADEIFKGAAAQSIDFTTKQRLCFPDLRPGDSWLFYLVRDKESDLLTLAYGSGSGPVTQESASVERLRRLSKYRDAGLIAGEVDISNGKPRAHYPIIVRSLASGAQHTAYTNKDGKFEFPPLPAGKYNLNPNTVPGLKATWSGEITVEARQCTNYFVNIEVDGRISGFVRNGDGTPQEFVAVEAVSADDSDNPGGSAITNGKGHYEIHGLDAGRYFVGLGIADAVDGNDALYAPGVKDRKRATTVTLGQADRHAGVDIRVP
jgi:Carboxypeptidase regulatory-like domain